ncbi:MAG: hypothetical protein LC793_23875 [Thermomicrobia bacterium]|nr:hypothetical protein [Thermomicrobia bacterium]
MIGNSTARNVPDSPITRPTAAAGMKPSVKPTATRRVVASTSRGNSPVSVIRFNAPKIAVGGGKNVALSSPERAAISQRTSSITGGRKASSRSLRGLRGED